MKKRILSAIISIAMILCLIPSVFAAYTEVNTQTNFDPYTKTEMNKLFAHGGATVNANGYVGGFAAVGGDNRYLVYKNMNFGDSGAVNLKMEYSMPNNGNYIGHKVEFRKNSAKGDLIASFTTKSTGGWEVFGTYFSADEFYAEKAKGTFDLYVVVVDAIGINLKSFIFEDGIKDAFSNVDALNDAINTTGFEMDSQNAEYGLVTGEGFSQTTGDYGALNATYRLNFELGYTSELTLNAFVTQSGKIAIFDGCVGANNANLLQEFELTTAENYENITLSLNDKTKEALKGKKDVCIAFDNSLEIALKTFRFIQNTDPFEGDDEINVVYIGGSITYGSGASSRDKSWASIIGETLKTKYGTGKTFNNYNVGIPGTGSDLGLMRLQEDVIAHNPDMVFVEFSVNDSGSAKGLYQMESIVKTLQNMEKIPYIMFIFTTTEALTGTSYQKYHRQVADFYSIPYVDLDARVKADGKVLHDLLCDTVHPNDTGYEYYASVINEALEKPENYVRPEKKTSKLSEKSKIVDIRTIPVSEFNVSGTSGEDYEIKNDKLYIYTEGTTVTASYTGDAIATRDYIFSNGGKYSINVDGIDIYERNTNYASSEEEVLNLGYLEMELPYDTHNVTITANSIGDGKSVVLGYLCYNAYENETQTITPTNDSYSQENQIMAVDFDEQSGLSINTNNYIGGTNDGKWLLFKDIDLSKGVGGVHLNYATKVNTTGVAQFRIGSTQGPVIAEFNGAQSTSSSSWETFALTSTQDIKTNVYGKVDLYLYFKDNSFANVRSFYFDPATSMNISNTILGTANYTEKSENIIVFNNNFENIKTGEYIKYSVNADEQFDAIAVKAATAEKSGKFIIRNGSVSGDIIAEVPIGVMNNKNTLAYVSAKLTQAGSTLSGNIDLYVTFEGEEGFAKLNEIKFTNLSGAETTALNAGNIGGTNLLTIVKEGSANWIEKNDLVGGWAVWNAIDFGDTQKLMNVAVTYAVPAHYANSAIEVRLDAPNGKLIARGILTSTGGWTKEGSITLPLMDAVTGVHSVYIMVTDSLEQVGLNKAGNIKQLAFTQANGNYLINTINSQSSYEIVMTAVENSEADSVQLLTAVYDSDGKFIKLYQNTNTPESGKVTVFNTTVEKSSLADLTGGYKIKTFVWDGNLRPLTDNVCNVADTVIETVE